MNEMEILTIIAIATIVTTIIQCIEMYLILHSQRKTNQILENPAPIVSGFLHALEDDKDFAREFGLFLVWAGQTGIGGIKSAMTEAGMKPPKIKSFGDALGFLIQLPQIQSAIQSKAAKMVEGAATETAKDSLW